MFTNNTKDNMINNMNTYSVNFTNKSNLENFTLLKKFDNRVVDLIQPPFEIGVMFPFPGEHEDDNLCCLLLDFSFAEELSFDAAVF